MITESLRINFKLTHMSNSDVKPLRRSNFECCMFFMNEDEN